MKCHSNSIYVYIYIPDAITSSNPIAMSEHLNPFTDDKLVQKQWQQKSKQLRSMFDNVDQYEFQIEETANTNTSSNSNNNNPSSLPFNNIPIDVELPNNNKRNNQRNNKPKPTRATQPEPSIIINTHEESNSKSGDLSHSSPNSSSNPRKRSLLQEREEPKESNSTPKAKQLPAISRRRKPSLLSTPPRVTITPAVNIDSPTDNDKSSIHSPNNQQVEKWGTNTKTSASFKTKVVYSRKIRSSK